MEAGAAAVAGAEGAAVAMVVRVFSFPGGMLVLLLRYWLLVAFAALHRRQLNSSGCLKTVGATFNKIACNQANDFSNL